MSDFFSSGRRSKAWWLSAIKSFGNKGASNIAKKVSISSYHVSVALVALTKSLDVEMFGKPGKGRRATYGLTPQGNRYLEDNQAELVEGGGEIARHPDSIDIPQTKTHTWSPIQLPETEEPHYDESKSETPTVPKLPENVKPIPESAGIPGRGVIISPAPTDFASEFKRVLISILLERYAANVTAAEVMQRLEAE